MYLQRPSPLSEHKLFEYPNVLLSERNTRVVQKVSDCPESSLRFLRNLVDMKDHIEKFFAEKRDRFWENGILVYILKLQIKKTFSNASVSLLFQNGYYFLDDPRVSQ